MFPRNLRKKALCIGISYKGQRGPYGVLPEYFELAGAHNDVHAVHDLLTECYGYEGRDITVLLDAQEYKQPTRENILVAMHELINDARPGDNLFFYFAGHGDQITNLDGTEYDNLDEIILPLDWKLDEGREREDRDRYSQIIIDDEMNDILVKQLPLSCRLTAVFDSCHSGTMLDLAYARFIGPRSTSPPQQRYIVTECRTGSPPQETVDVTDPIQSDPIIRGGPLELSFAARLNSRGRNDPRWRKGTWVLRGETLDSLAADRLLPQVHAISWSACSDGQFGYEIRSRHENRSGGVMTKAFVKILRAQHYQSYLEILQCLAQRLREACHKINQQKPEAQWIMQEPQFGSQQKPDLDKLFAP